MNQNGYKFGSNIRQNTFKMGLYRLKLKYFCDSIDLVILYEF